MYSAEPLKRAGLLALLCGALAGCAVLDANRPRYPSRWLRPRAAAPQPPSATAPAAAASATATPQAPREPAAPVSPAVQRAFDDAVRALRAGRTDEAERGFRALAAAHPELGGPQANLGLIYLRADRPAEAVAALEKAVAANPEQPRYFNQLGIAYRQHGQFAKARGAYEQAIELDPDYAAAYMNLGILHDLYLRDSRSRAGALRPLPGAVAAWRSGCQQVGRRPEEPPAACRPAGRQGEAMNSLPRWARAGAVLLGSVLVAAPTFSQDRADIDRTQIIGNRELPKVLYIVPWKKPLPGELTGRPPASVVDEALAPLDRDVFRRQLSYDAQTRPPPPAAETVTR